MKKVCMQKFQDFNFSPRLGYYKKSPFSCKMKKKIESSYNKFKPERVSSFLCACFSSFITARNGGRCTILGNDSARGFSNAVAGDGLAIDRSI